MVFGGFMFGIFNMTREDALKSTRGKVKEKENNDEPCYGGFRSRWSYEDCCRKHSLRGPSRANAALCVIVCFFFGFAGLAGGIIIFDFMQQHKNQYYPDGSLQVPDEIIIPSPTSPDMPAKPNGSATSSPNGFIDFSTQAGGIKFENVTADLSKLYRIPRGVMVKITDNSGAVSNVFNAGDIIVAVNDIEIHDIESLNEESKYNSEDETVTITIFRKNKYIDLVIVNNTNLQ